ncbi:MAG: LAGLIDADG family homing endonuclease, partial [Myxococcota bacterium]
MTPPQDSPPQPRAALRGRGSAENPPNRFERLHYEEEDPELDPETEPGSVPTQYLGDPSRSVIAWNQSPDLGFAASLNPYRGCEHGCSYCLSPDTPVLHADMLWRPIGDLRGGETLASFDEHPQPGRTRKLRPATVEAVWWSRRPTLRLLTRHAEVVTTREHRWLQARDFRWSRTEQLTPGRLLRRLPLVPAEPWDGDYRAGYLAGLTLGDGTFRYQPGWRSDKLGFPAAYWRVALVDLEPLERSREFLSSFGVNAQIRPFKGGPSSRQPLSKLEIRSLGRLETVHKLVEVERSSRSYRRGFLAGFFDAEGHSSHVLRISQVDLGVLERVRGYASSLGFEFRLERRDPRASTLR